MSLTGPIQLAPQDVFKTSTSKLMRLGSQGITRDGRLFRYGLAGAVALSAGKLVQIPAVVANHQNLAVQTAAVVGDTTLLLTLGATAATQDQYADGYAVGYDVAGIGQCLNIQGNASAALSTTVSVFLADPVATAAATTGKFNLELNPYAGVLISTSGDTTEMVVGVPNVAIAAASYGWFQTRGVAAVLSNGTITKGAGVIKSATTAGATDIEATGTITQRVGTQLQTGTSTKYNTTYLTID
jgi:hypothetical protein